jgi:hypothetical protein
MGVKGAIKAKDRKDEEKDDSAAIASVLLRPPELLTDGNIDSAPRLARPPPASDLLGVRQPDFSRFPKLGIEYPAAPQATSPHMRRGDLYCFIRPREESSVPIAIRTVRCPLRVLAV